MIKIIVISGTFEGSSRLIDALGQDAEVVAVSKENKALVNLRNHKFDLIIFGDALEQGDLYGVALELKNMRTNRRAPVVLLGRNPAVRTRIRNALQPHAFE